VYLSTQELNASRSESVQSSSQQQLTSHSLGLRSHQQYSISVTHTETHISSGLSFNSPRYCCQQLGRLFDVSICQYVNIYCLTIAILFVTVLAKQIISNFIYYQPKTPPSRQIIFEHRKFSS